MKRYKTLLLLSVLVTLMIACSKEKKEQDIDMSCKISGSLAPMWVCIGDDFNPNTISAVGKGSISGGEAFQRKVAFADGRSALAKQIKDVRPKISLKKSRIINQWIEPKSKDLYFLVSMKNPK